MTYLKIWRNFFKLNEKYSMIIWLFSIFNSANGFSFLSLLQVGEDFKTTLNNVSSTKYNPLKFGD